MIPTIDFAVFVQWCKAAHDVRNLPLCTVYVVLLLPSWCCKAQLLTIYLADPCRFDEIFQTKFFSHTTSFYHIWASDACAVQGRRSSGCQGVGGTLQHPQILTDQLTLFKLGHSRKNRLYLFQVVSNHCGCTPRGVMGVKWPEILWEIQKYSLPGRPSSQNWVKSKTIKKFIKIP